MDLLLLFQRLLLALHTLRRGLLRLLLLGLTSRCPDPPHRQRPSPKTPRKGRPRKKRRARLPSQKNLRHVSLIQKGPLIDGAMAGPISSTPNALRNRKVEAPAGAAPSKFRFGYDVILGSWVWPSWKKALLFYPWFELTQGWAFKHYSRSKGFKQWVLSSWLPTDQRQGLAWGERFSASRSRCCSSSFFCKTSSLSACAPVHLARDQLTHNPWFQGSN